MQRKPEVGLGVVGTNTVRNSFPFESDKPEVTKPIDKIPALGNSIRTTDLKEPLEETLSDSTTFFALE